MFFPGPVRRMVSDLRPGDHAWLAFAGEDERNLVVGSFIDTALAGEDKVVVLAGREEITLPTGDRVTVVPLSEHPSQALDPRRPAQVLRTEIDRAQRAGYRGVRIVADLTWTLRTPGGAGLVLDCERHIEEVVGPSTSAIAICQVDRRACRPRELAALKDAHPVTVTADPDFADSVLRIDRTFHPLGLALSGELDAARHAVFGEALSQALARANGSPVHVDMAELKFIDVGALAMLARAADARPRGGPLVLDRMPAPVRSMVEMIGLDRLPGLRLGIPHPDVHGPDPKGPVPPLRRAGRPGPPGGSRRARAAPCRGG